MGVNANTIETYDNSVIREDLSQQYYMISPEECPYQQIIGTGEACTQTYHEWSTLALPTPVTTNRVIEGEDAPAIEAGVMATRLGNYTQISDKQVSVSHTSEAVDAAAMNVQKLAKQVAIQLRALKRDMEVMLLSNIAAAAGSSGNARQAAGLPAFIRTNVIAGSGGTNPTLSGTTSGYPNAAAAAGTVMAFDEDDFLDLVEDVWQAGGNPTIALVTSTNKRIISESFTGTATKYKDVTDKTLINAVDIYVSDFGEQTVVPSRFIPAIDAPTNTSWPVFLLDPDFIELNFLETVKQTPIAKTGHSNKRLLWCEYTQSILNEAALGIIRDTNHTIP